jgi:hypothetical protein
MIWNAFPLFDIADYKQLREITSSCLWGQYIRYRSMLEHLVQFLVNYALLLMLVLHEADFGIHLWCCAGLGLLVKVKSTDLLVL